MNLRSRLEGPDVPTVDVVAAHERAPGVVLLDVREVDEWLEVHAPGAHLQPLSALDLATLPDAETFYVVCRSGQRSAVAAQAMIEAGLDARNVVGGMNAWVQAGLPVEHG